MITGQCWELQLLSLTSWKHLRIILGNQLFSTIRAEETRPLMVHSPCGLGTESQTQRSKRNDSQFRGSHKLGKNNMYKKDQLDGDDSKSDSRPDYWAHNGIYRCWVPRKHTWPLSKVIQWCFLLGKNKNQKHTYQQVLIYLARIRNAGFHTFIDYIECLLYSMILLGSIHRMTGQEHFSNRLVILKTKPCKCIPVPWEHIKCILALIWKWDTLKKDTFTSLGKFSFENWKTDSVTHFWSGVQEKE